MGFVKESKASNMAAHARRAMDEGHRVFVAQLRGALGHSPSLSRPVQDVAEMIEAIESIGWELEQFTSVPFKKNMTTTCLFRRPRRPPQAQYPQPAYNQGLR
jgi:hypothetical protein